MDTLIYDGWRQANRDTLHSAKVFSSAISADLALDNSLQA